MNDDNDDGPSYDDLDRSWLWSHATTIRYYDTKNQLDLRVSEIRRSFYAVKGSFELYVN